MTKRVKRTGPKKSQEILQIRVLQIICEIFALFTHEAGEDNEEMMDPQHCQSLLRCVQ